MKKVWIVLLLMAVLAGCRSGVDLETVTDIFEQPPANVAGDILLELPEDASAMVIGSNDSGKIYFCDGYQIVLQTLEAGDLDRTLREISGYTREALTVMKTVQQNMDRYDFVWSAAGEGEMQLMKAAILDDGTYHYAVTAMTDHVNAERLNDVWKSIFQSFSVINTAP